MQTRNEAQATITSTSGLQRRTVDSRGRLIFPFSVERYMPMLISSISIELMPMPKLKMRKLGKEQDALLTAGGAYAIETRGSATSSRQKISDRY